MLRAFSFVCDPCRCSSRAPCGYTLQSGQNGLGAPAMGSRRNDLLQALRVFGRSPGFAVVTTVVLAVGIGAAISIFTVFSALMLRPLPLPHPEQLVEVSGIYRNHARIVLSYPMFRQLAHEQSVFSGLCGWSSSTGANVETNGVLGVAELRTVTGGYYVTLEERPLLGRLIAESDEQGSHAAPVAVIGYQFWLKDRKSVV